MRNHHNVGGYPSFSTQNSGFFVRHMRRLSSGLPRFSPDSTYAQKEKLGRGRGQWAARNVPLVGRLRSIFGRMGRKLKVRLLIVAILLLCLTIFYNSRGLPNIWARLPPQRPR